MTLADMVVRRLEFALTNRPPTSPVIRQVLSQLEDRGDTAIVYDPALEYTPQLYSLERGDATFTSGTSLDRSRSLLQFQLEALARGLSRQGANERAK